MPTPTSNTLTGERLQSMLTGLGSTAGEITATLRAAGIKGHQADAHDCPGARFIATHARELLPGTDRIAVTLTAERAVIGITSADPDEYREVTASTPETVEYFLDRFDQGDHEDLIEACAS
jgi:hypothetical protein